MDQPNNDSAPGGLVIPGPPKSVAGTDGDESTTTTAARSYSPYRAWGEWQPARLFNYNECKGAKDWARQHSLALYALEVSNESRAMNYVVGTWETARDMVVRRELFGPHGPLLSHNTEALGAVYECLFKDQRCLPLFDLEFYADRKHANEHLYDMAVMDRLTRLVARTASALMAELFPDQVELCTGTRPALAPHPHSPHEGWPSRVLKLRHYEAPKGLRGAPVRLDPECDWRVLDASMGSKRSQHLILDPDAGLCWDTLVDQALFVGLLMRRIYRAAFALDVASAAGDDDDKQLTAEKNRQGSSNNSNNNNDIAWRLNAGFRQAVQQLFVSDLHGDTQRIWTTVVDPVVYKSFQLVRTAYSSKRTQERPLLPRPEVFGLGADAVFCEVAGQDPPGPSRSRLLEHTLVGRVGRDISTQRLSFSRCYPSMFGEAGAGGAPGCASARTVPTSSRQLGAWRWVPNYHGRGQDAPPRLIHTASGQGKAGPWDIRKHRRAVATWLRRVDPTAAPPTAHLIPAATRLGSMPSKATLRAWTGNSSPDSVDYARGEASTATECVAEYIGAVTSLQPWVRAAGGIDELSLALRIKVNAFRDRRTEATRYSALVDPGQKYCPIQRTVHDSGRPFLLIDARRGTARIKCLAGKCSQQQLRLPMTFLPEHLDLIFRGIRKRAHTEHTPSPPQQKSTPNPAPKRPRRK